MASSYSRVLTDKSSGADGPSTDQRIRIDRHDGRSVDVEITGESANRARVDVHFENRQWVFGVNGESATLLMVLNENGQRVADELPEWIEPLLQRFGLEGVEE